VTITNLTAGLASMNLAGPLARGVLAQLTDCDLSSAAFPYMDWRQASVAGVAATMMRIGFVGEMGWEIVVVAEYGSHLWQQVLQAGASVNLRPFGVETQRVLRLEKKHIIVGVDTDALSNPYEAGMAWVAKLDKADFIGRVALARMKQNPLERTLVGFELEGAAASRRFPNIIRRQTGRLCDQCSLLLGETESDRDGMGHPCGSHARHADYSALRRSRLFRERGRRSLLRPGGSAVERCDGSSTSIGITSLSSRGSGSPADLLRVAAPSLVHGPVERARGSACFRRYFRRELLVQARSTR
jgi:hypothetical protein